MLIIKRSFQYIIQRLKNIHEHDTKTSYLFVLVAFFIAAIISAITATGSPTGISMQSHILGVLVAILIHIGIYTVFLIVISSILSLLLIPIPRIATTAVIYVGILLAIILDKADSGFYFSIILGILASLATIVISLILHVFWQFKYGKIMSIIFIGIFFLAVQIIGGWNPSETTITPQDPANPASFGNYETIFFTYGSGSDVHRKEFANKVDFRTSDVDASHFVTKWSKKRRDFWEFGPENFPINGRAWMPQGDGPFPVVLMVHGNHTMEYLSTAGYDYLGELLASRGFFFVSVDEDYVNYSNMTGQPNDNYELRAWLLLQHLVQLQDMNNDQDHPLYQKLNLDKVALGGHSRGGQAAAMAADYYSFFAEDEQLINDLSMIDIQAVIAVSPTDKLINNQSAQLYDTSFLTLHGSHDTDVYSFRGDFQFYRTNFDPYSHHLKSTVYIENANHVHFNSDWGNVDLSYPRGLFLNQYDLLQAKEQQQIAKVYISAFLEQVLHLDKQYISLFEQNEQSTNWLPNTEIITKYRPATYRTVQSYADLPRRKTYFDEYTGIEKHQPIKRSGKNYTNQSLKLSFEEHAFHKINFPMEDLMNGKNEQANQLILTIANAAPDEQIDMKITLLIQGEELNTWERTLSSVIEIDATTFGLFDDIFRDGKYEQTWEPIFENIAIPLDDLIDYENEQIELLIEFQGENGIVLLEEIGVY